MGNVVGRHQSVASAEIARTSKLHTSVAGWISGCQLQVYGCVDYNCQVSKSS